MTKQDAIDHFGTQTALVLALKDRGFAITQATVSEWKEIPLIRQFEIEITTGGTLKADIPETMRLALGKRIAA